MRWLICAIVCCLGATALGEPVQPRAHVREIAKLIESHYYEVEHGRAIAQALTREAEQAVFDDVDTPHDLASRLTDRLRSVDRHFKVMWGEAPRGEPQRRGRQPEGAQHGFGRVERLSGKVGYVELLEATHIDFSDPASPVRAKADAVLAQLRDASAYILDLRSNRGGSPAMVGYLVSAFVNPTADVYNAFHTRDAVFSERPDVRYTNPLTSAPLFVLVGPGTASAAESLAYTLQACGRAVIVGEPSAGAANPGAMFPTASGYSVFVPTGSPRNPITQRNWEGEGVQPDVRVAAADAMTKAHQLAISE